MNSIVVQRDTRRPSLTSGLCTTESVELLPCTMATSSTEMDPFGKALEPLENLAQLICTTGSGAEVEV